MKATTVLGVMFAAAAFAAPAHAVFKCTTANGVVYQDVPCREGNESQVRIVIPTGELAPKNLANASSGAQGNSARGDNAGAARKSGRAAGEDSSSLKGQSGRSGNSAGGRGYESGAGNDARSKDAQGSAVTGSSETSAAAEQARRTEPSAKYYTTEAFSSGNETPAHMTCETGNGEKRVFYLSNGKLTSI